MATEVSIEELNIRERFLKRKTLSGEGKFGKELTELQSKHSTLKQNLKFYEEYLEFLQEIQDEDLDKTE